LKNIKKSNEKSGQKEFLISTTDLKSGIYFYTLKNNSEQTNGKLIKK